MKDKKDDKFIINLPCKVGDKVFIADKEQNKVLSFEIDCIKVFEDNITAHGYRQAGWAKFNIPIEYSLKNFGKRIIFKTRKEAKNGLK